MDVDQPIVEAVLVDGNAIKAVGTLASLTSQSRAKIISYPESTIIPGLIEPHTHPIASALLGAAVNVGSPSYTSRSDVMQALSNAVDGVQLTPWIVAFGWDPIAVPGMSPPTLAELDEISPDRPMLILTQMLHDAFVNSAGLQAAGIPLSNGAELKELTLVNRAISAIPPPPDPVVELLVRRQYQAYAEAGFTSIGIAGAVGRHPDPVGLLHEIGSGASPSLRSFVYLLDGQSNAGWKPQSRFSIVGYKFWLDGSPFPGGAATHAAEELTSLTTETRGLSPGHRGALLLHPR